LRGPRHSRLRFPSTAGEAEDAALRFDCFPLSDWLRIVYGQRDINTAVGLSAIYFNDFTQASLLDARRPQELFFTMPRAAYQEFNGRPHLLRAKAGLAQTRRLAYRYCSPI
jgi:hypothetical protein